MSSNDCRNGCPFLWWFSHYDSSVQLTSRNLGPGDLPVYDHANSDDEAENHRGALPGARRGDDRSTTAKLEVLTHQVAFSGTGREWAVVTGEGWLQVYSLEDSLVFDPIDLSQHITPSSIFWHLSLSQYGLALKTSLALNEESITLQVLDGIPFSSISAVARQINPEYLPSLLSSLARQVSESPHVEFYLEWALQLLMHHGTVLGRQHRNRFLRALRTLHREIAERYKNLQAAASSNRYLLEFLEEHGKLVAALESNGERAPMPSDR